MADPLEPLTVADADDGTNATATLIAEVTMPHYPLTAYPMPHYPLTTPHHYLPHLCTDTPCAPLPDGLPYMAGGPHPASLYGRCTPL